MSEPDAIRIVEVNTQGNILTLNTDKLGEILNHTNIRDRNLVVISITGVVRKGKSFMLNFFIRYLKAKYANAGIEDALDWLGDASEPLQGFSWRGGSERNTIGVLIWPEIFLHDYANGKKVAIMLIDTQGIFDSKTTFDGNVTIFALSAMLSSVQIYNVSNNIQEDQLQYLSLFAEYGKLALENPLNKPFQKLLFLVRDWFYPYEADFGYTGGRFILNRAFTPESSSDDTESLELRENIKACFEDIDCFLMPYPGTVVATSPNFNGSISQIDEEFVTNLRALIPSILEPRKLITKKINGVEIRAQDFVHYLAAYMRVLTGNRLPNPKTILSATADAQNLAAIADARSDYDEEMERVVSGNTGYKQFSDLVSIHNATNERALRKFVETPKLQGADKSSTEYERELDGKLKKQFHYYLIRNERNRPDLSPKIQELVDTITREKELSDDLNAKNTKMILDMINTLNESTDEYRRQVDEIVEAFRQSRQQGMDTMGIINQVIGLIPHVISVVALFL